MATFSKSPRRTLAVIALLALGTLFVLILIPSFRPARELDGGPSHRIAMNLNGITKACLVYASDNNDHFPPHPVILILDGSVSPSHFSTPGAKTLSLPNPPPPPSAWPTLAADLDQHSIFIYTAADLTGTVDPEVILAYTKKSPLLPNYRLVAFGDAHIENIPESQLPQLFAASNTARAKLGLPPFTLDGPTPGSPR
jgi:hypothetical protein